MKPENMIRCAGLMVALMMTGLTTLAQARDPGVNQPGAYGGTAGVGARPGVGAGRAGAPAAAGGAASGMGVRPGAGAGRAGAPPAAGGAGGAASGVGVKPGAGAGRAGRRR